MNSFFTQPLHGETLDSCSPYFTGIPFVRVPGTNSGKLSYIPFSEEMLSKHCLLLGGTGSGKTNFLYHLVSQIKSKLSNNDIMIIFDTKGDYAQRFYNNTSDVVIGNSSQYKDISASWNLYKEIVFDGWDNSHIVLNANEIAWSFFQEAIISSNEPFFPKAARDLFAAILIHFLRIGGNDTAFMARYFNNSGLRRVLDLATPPKITSILKNEPDLSAVSYYLGETENTQGLGVFSELQQTIRNVLIGVFAQKGTFSIRDFVRSKGGRTLFIEYDLAMGSTLTPIYRLLIDLALKEALSADHASGNVYIICDEFKLLPHLQHIEDAVNFGRSLGVKVIAGLQSIAQLYEIYGENHGQSIAAGFSTIVSFHLNDTVSRNFIKELYGKNVALEQYTLPSGSVLEQTREGNVVEDWDISSLKVGEAIVGFPLAKPFKFQTALYR